MMIRSKVMISLTILEKKIIKNTEFRVINSQKLKTISEMDTPYLITHPRGNEKVKI